GLGRRRGEATAATLRYRLDSDAALARADVLGRAPAGDRAAVVHAEPEAGCPEVLDRSPAGSDLGFDLLEVAQRTEFAEARADLADREPGRQLRRVDPLGGLVQPVQDAFSALERIARQPQRRLAGRRLADVELDQAGSRLFDLVPEHLLPLASLVGLAGHVDAVGAVPDQRGFRNPAIHPDPGRAVAGDHRLDHERQVFGHEQPPDPMRVGVWQRNHDLDHRPSRPSTYA